MNIGFGSLVPWWRVTVILAAIVPETLWPRLEAAREKDRAGLEG